MRKLAFAFLAGIIAHTAALANDSSAELATGGLVFVRNSDIEMRSEALFVSAEEIRVRYRFVNKSDKNVVTHVAFPMPDIGVEGPDQNIAVPTEDPQNILGFSTNVNGRTVTMSIEQKLIAAGVERTEFLRKAGIPLAPHLRSTNEALDRLPRAAWDQFTKLGLAEIEEYDVGKGMEKHLSWLDLEDDVLLETDVPGRPGACDRAPL